MRSQSFDRDFGNVVRKYLCGVTDQKKRVKKKVRMMEEPVLLEDGGPCYDIPIPEKKTIVILIEDNQKKQANY